MKTLLLRSLNPSVGQVEVHCRIAPEVVDEPDVLAHTVAMLRQARDGEAFLSGRMPRWSPWTEGLWLLEHEDVDRAFMEGWEPIRLPLEPESVDVTPGLK